MTKIYSGIGVFFLMLAYYMFVPERTCAVEWTDIHMNPIDGPFQKCLAYEDKRHIGIFEFTRVGSDVYRVEQNHGNGRLPPRGLRPRILERVLLIKLDGPIDWDKLRSYYNERYLSDGNVVLNLDGARIPALTPPLAVAKLRAVPGSKSADVYATDGYWVLNSYQVVADADAATFEELMAFESDGTRVSFGIPMEFGRDKNRIYHGANHFDDADPDTFGLISYNQGRDPPPGINFRTNSVSLGSAWVAVDKNHAWEVDFTGILPLQVTADQLKALQQDLRTRLLRHATVPNKTPS